jgi:hypothetical protein
MKKNALKSILFLTLSLSIVFPHISHSLSLIGYHTPEEIAAIKRKLGIDYSSSPSSARNPNVPLWIGEQEVLRNQDFLNSTANSMWETYQRARMNQYNPYCVTCQPRTSIDTFGQNIWNMQRQMPWNYQNPYMWRIPSTFPDYRSMPNPYDELIRHRLPQSYPTNPAYEQCQREVKASGMMYMMDPCQKYLR